MTRRTIGWAAIVGFLLTIPAANYAIDHLGDAPAFPGGPHTITILAWTVPSGTAFIGLSFVLRDLGQYVIGRWAAWVAIAIGIGLSYLLASAAVATASAVAFAWSEITDTVGFTVLADRGRFTLGVLVSGVLASVVDSFLFLWIAFGWSAARAGWVDLFVVKSLFVVVAAPIAYAARRAARPRAVPGDLASRP